MKQKLAPTQQWHDVHSPKVGRHPPPNHSTLQWHLAPPPKLAVTLPSPSTLKWHPAMAPRLLHPAIAPRPLPQSWSSPV